VRRWKSKRANKSPRREKQETQEKNQKVIFGICSTERHNDTRPIASIGEIETDTIGMNEVIGTKGMIALIGESDMSAIDVTIDHKDKENQREKEK
jgi:hypothetical protein